MNLANLPLLEKLAPCQRILLAGAGGGFDITAGVPLFEYLRSQGKEVFLGSLSFAEIKNADGRRLSRGDILEVRPGAGGDDDFFPERRLSEWYAEKGQDVPVYCYSPTGAVGLKQIFRDLIEELQVEALVLVDGGTDSLMRGDEPSLGSPAEDMASLAAADMIDLPIKLLVCLGFGVDVAHGVCHAYVLEAAADMSRDGTFLGAFSLLPGMPEFQAFAEAIEYINERTPAKESIVASSVVAAGQGHFGDFHPTRRTAGSTLFINPLMSMYWCFELQGVTRRCLYLDYIRDTHSRWDIHRAINNYLYTTKSREWMNIPL